MMVTVEYRTEFGQHDWITCPYDKPEDILMWLSGFCANLLVLKLKVMK